jgi:hypothetical protein
MNIEMLRNYPKNTLNSAISNDLYANYRFPDEIGPNNLEISFLQKKRNLERTMIHNKWKNSITPKKELDFFISKEQESFNEVFNKKNIDEFQGQIDNVINAQKTNSILDNKKINVEQMKSDSLHLNNYKNINYIKEMMNQNCNEIKVMKNNKVVYANNIDSFSKINKMGKKKNLFDIRKRKRGSKYRGVSKNGNQWQVLIMFRNSKSYIGTYSSEELAARVYDISAIKNKGVKAITNFNYSPKQINNILSNDIDIKAKNINLIILDLLKEK